MPAVSFSNVPHPMPESQSAALNSIQDSLELSFLFAHISVEFRQDYIALETESALLYVIGNVYGNKNPVIEPNKTWFTQFIQSLDGVFLAILICKQDQTIFCAVDKYGFYPAFLFVKENIFVLTNTLKSLFKFNFISLEFERDAITSYLLNGHFVGEKAWYKDCNRLAAATVYTIHIDDSINVVQERHWSWSDLELKYRNKPTLLAQYAKAFYNAVEERSKQTGVKRYVGLSGGIDSRVITSTLYNQHKEFKAYSFGDPTSFDLQYAADICKALNIQHTTFQTHLNDWITERFRAFEEMDGLLNIYHFHEGNIHNKIHQIADQIFHGFYGMHNYVRPTDMDKRVDASLVKKYVGHHYNPDIWEDPFYNIPQMGPFITDQKIRWVAAIGLHLFSQYSRIETPFASKQCIETVYSGPEALRKHYTLYYQLAKSIVPKQILDIPLQRHNLSLRTPQFASLMNQLYYPQIRERMYKLVGKSIHYLNYASLDAGKSIHQIVLEEPYLAQQFGDITGYNYLDDKLNPYNVISILLYLRIYNRNLI